MDTILIILGVIVFDVTVGYIITHSKNKRDKLFLSNLEGILKTPQLSKEDKFNKAKELCRNTVGRTATGAYFALDYMNELS